jgi:regulator of protease activity HflC (stomatin/prohibitin superfamily)
MDEVGEHVEFIRDAREGRRPVHLKYLGLTIERFGADNIEPSGETIENVAAVNKAQFLAEQRKRAAKGLADAAKKLAAVPGTQGDPTRTILIAEGIVKEDVKVTRLEASPQILTAAEGTLGPIFSALAGRIRGKE